MSTMPELGAMSLKKISTSRLGSALPVLLALAAIWIYFGLTEPAFLSPRNFYYLFMQSSVVGTLAVGITNTLDFRMTLDFNAGAYMTNNSPLVPSNGKF